jgi:hypothetical protein
MYSADAISKRQKHTEPTEEMIAGLVCIVCRTDYRQTPDKDPKVVSYHGEQPLLACAGVCARMAGGSITGLPDAPPPAPLEDRVRAFRPAGR